MEMAYGINESKRSNLEYYKNNCIAFFIPAAFTALSILEKDAFQFSSSELQAGYTTLQDFFKFEFAYNIDKPAPYCVRKNIRAFVDDAILMPHETIPDTYYITSAGFRKLKLFSGFLKPYFESYWIVLSFLKQHKNNSMNPKDRLKKIQSLGNRMYKKKEIDRIEALSKINYTNAENLFSAQGIKGSDNSEKINHYSNIIQQSLNCLQ